MPSPALPDSNALQVRAAEPTAFDPIIAVVDMWWGRPVRHALSRLHLDHFHRTSRVAEDADGLAGFVIGFCSPSLQEEAYIHFAGVAPTWRRSGLARRLYGDFFGIARDAGRTRVKAMTAPQNERSIAFHRALGFAVEGPIPDYDGPGAAKVVFTRQL